MPKAASKYVPCGACGKRTNLGTPLFRWSYPPPFTGPAFCSKECYAGLLEVLGKPALAQAHRDAKKMRATQGGVGEREVQIADWRLSLPTKDSSARSRKSPRKSPSPTRPAAKSQA